MTATKDAELYRVSYKGKWFGAMWARRPGDALAAIRRNNPTHLRAQFAVDPISEQERARLKKAGQL